MAETRQSRDEGCGCFGFVVAVNGRYRRNPAQFIQHPQFTNVTGVQNEVNTGEDGGNGRGQCAPSLRHMCIGNKADAGSHLLWGYGWREITFHVPHCSG